MEYLLPSGGGNIWLRPDSPDALKERSGCVVQRPVPCQVIAWNRGKGTKGEKWSDCRWEGSGQKLGLGGRWTQGSSSLNMNSPCLNFPNLCPLAGLYSGGYCQMSLHRRRWAPVRAG